MKKPLKFNFNSSNLISKNMKKNISLKIASLTFGILVISFAVGFYVFSWTEPTASPPEGNAPLPLNVSEIGQEKAGGLILNTGGALIGLIIDNGMVGIGTRDPGSGIHLMSYWGGPLLQRDRTMILQSSEGIGDGRNNSPGISFYSSDNIFRGGLGLSGRINAWSKFSQPGDVVFRASEGGSLILATAPSPTTQDNITPKLYIENEGNIGIGTISPTEKLDVFGYVKGTGFCIGPDCIISWPRIAHECKRKRSAVQQNDSVVYCNENYPILYSCRLIDDQAPGALPTDLSSYCDYSGLCHAGSGAPPGFPRVGLGADVAYLETVINSSGTEGCWQYDNAHSRTSYKLEIMCCKN